MAADAGPCARFAVFVCANDAIEPAFWSRTAMPVRPLLAYGLMFLAASGAHALKVADGWMTADELGRAFTAVTLDGRYPGGDHFTEAYAADGSVSYSDDRRQSGGHWSVQSDTFCTIYDDDAAGGCFRVRRTGENCFEFYFVARTETDAAQGRTRGPDWTAQAWRNDSPATCVAGANV